MAYLLPDAVSPGALLQDLLTISLTAINLLRPLYDEAGELTDFAPEYFNPAAQRMTGLLTERPAGTARSLFPASFTNGVFAFYRRVFETGEAGHFELNYQADGLDNYFRVAAQRSGDLLLVSFTDTADQNRSAVEVALRESQAAEQAARAEAELQRQRFYELLMQLPAQVAVHEGPDHVFTLVNPGYQRLAPGRDLFGQPIRTAWPELVSQGILDVLDHVYRTGEPFIGKELPFQVDFTRTGQVEQVYFNAFFLPLRNTQGQLRGVLDFSVDVTAQVRARQQVEQLNQDLEARVLARTRELAAAQVFTERQRWQWSELFRRTPVGICIFNGPQWVYEFVNPSYQALFPGRALLGKPLVVALPEVADQPLMAILHRVYDTGEPFEAREVLVSLARTESGPVEDIYFDLVYQARYNEAGQIDGFITFATDVTPQVLARRQVQALNQQLGTLNQELQATNEVLYETNHQLTRTNVDLDTFVYTASHDLKAPISNIESIVLALRDTLPPAEQQNAMVAQLLDLLDATTARFQFTIAQLTDLTKLQLAHAGPAEPVVLAQVVEAVRLDLAPAIIGAAAQLTVDVAPEVVVSFSPANLRSVVYNLLSNAVKYRAADRAAQVRLRVTQTPQAVVLTVADNGLGLNEHQQSRLFGLFQRLHTHVEGTGVGLYITKRLVENGGGTISVESKLNAGTTFTVTLPV